MTPLVTADAGLTERILDGTHEIWSEGLGRSDYSRWQQAQLDTPWGRQHLCRVALLDGDDLLASAKQYDFTATIGGDRLSVLGIGAVFTPPAHRGQGHARRLIEAMTADADLRGCRAALLFSEIGPAYYEPMGFEVVRRDVATFAAADRRPGTLGARPGESRDLPAMADLSSGMRLPSGLALDRSADLIHFGLVRRSRLAALSRPGRLAVEWLVAEDAGRLSAYLIATRRPRGLVIEDCADLEPTGAEVAELVASLMARPSFHPPIVHGWLPEAFRGWTRPAIWDAAADHVMMIKALGAAPRLAIARPVTYWNLDVF
jgi:GNAT superfamily N-acetyltransferase